MRISALALVALSGVLAACATTSTPQPKQRAQIQIQEQVGFTISEPVSVSDAVRMDYDSALLLLEQGQADEGIAILERVVAQAPDVSGPRIDLGIAAHQAGDLEAAEQHLLAALELNPDHPVVHNELGIIYRKTGRFQEARKSYESALDVYPGFHFARRNLAVLCDLYLADLECALQNYEAYMKTVPSDEEASMWIADIRYRLDQ